MNTITGKVVATTKEKDGSMRVCLQHDGYAQIYRVSKSSSLQFAIDAPEYKQSAHTFAHKAGRLLYEIAGKKPLAIGDVYPVTLTA